MAKGLDALNSLLSQISVSTVVFVFSGFILLDIGLIAYLILTYRWEKSHSGRVKLRRLHRILLVLFIVFWVILITLILIVDKSNGSQEFAAYLVPFDPSTIFIEGYDRDYILSDLSNWMTAPWVHQRRILVFLLNFLLFFPLGASLPGLLPRKHRYVLTVLFLLIFAAVIAIAQLVMMSGTVYADNTLMRFFGGLLGAFAHRIVSRSHLSEKGGSWNRV